MTSRKDPFATLLEVAEFGTKPIREKPVSSDSVERIAETRNFPSREAPKPTTKPKRTPRHYRTGRNQHLGIKTTIETRDRFYKLADDRNVPLGELLRLALDALERAGGA
jgi:hypothetical protein